MLAIDRLLERMARLRDPNGGGPWELAQTFATIAPYTIEEAYEVDDAIRREAWPELCDELGDLLLQVVFHAQIARDAGLFTFDDVVAAISDKLARRQSAWNASKAAERAARGVRELDSVPRALPALLQAAKLARLAAHDDDSAQAETRDEAALGDALFDLARRASRAGLDPEAALRAACERFRARHAAA